MSDLRQLLADFSKADLYAGPAEKPQDDRRARDQRQLRKDFGVLRSRHDRRAKLYVGALAGTLVALLVLAVLNAGRPTVVSALFAAAGVSVGSMLVALNRVWKELYQIDVFLALIGRLTDEQLQNVCLAFLHKSLLEGDAPPAVKTPGRAPAPGKT